MIAEIKPNPMELLRSISGIDQEIAGLNEKMAPFIERKKRLEADIEASVARLSVLDSKILLLQKTTASGDLEIRSLCEKRNSESSKLDSIQSVKAAEAVQAELKGIADMIESIEEKTLGDMMDLEELENEKSAIQKKSGNHVKELEELVVDMEKTELIIDSKTCGLEENRREMAESLPDLFKKTYFDLIDRRKYDNPIVTISDYSCPVCGSIFKPNVKAYLASGKPEFCITCHRVMIR